MKIKSTNNVLNCKRPPFRKGGEKNLPLVSTQFSMKNKTCLPRFYSKKPLFSLFSLSFPLFF